MTDHLVAFDHWIRTSFVEMNSALEEIYFAQENRMALDPAGSSVRSQLVHEGNSFICALSNEDNLDEGFDSGFALLGNVGMYMAACRRHEITVPSRESSSPLVQASALASYLGARLGVAPRFATSHLTTHNRAFNGRYKTFTSLRDETVFLDFNTLGVLAYKRAADALVRILPIGISHPMTYELLRVAEDALREVTEWNSVLFDRLDPDRFFYCVRPYYKPYRVGPHVYRGANAGDFAGINETDMLLGVCNANNSFYAQLLVDKFLYMTPENQARLRECMRHGSLLSAFLDEAPQSACEPWFRKNGRKFLDVCALHGQAARQHHDQLVRRFIERPAAALSPEELESITASGPPLDVLLRSLEVLKDMRAAAERDDISSRYRDFRELRHAIGQCGTASSELA